MPAAVLKHPLPVGARCEAQDANGTWWEVVVSDVNDDGSYKADVEDGTGTVWEEVHACSMQLGKRQVADYEKLADELEYAEKRKKEEECVDIEKQMERVQRGGVKAFEKRDPVDVKHRASDSWKPGVVISVDPVMVECNGAINTFKYIRFSCTALIHPLAVGTKCESVDANGTWWECTVSKILGGDAYAVIVNDGAGTVWDSVAAGNMRKPQLKKGVKESKAERRNSFDSDDDRKKTSKDKKGKKSERKEKKGKKEKKEKKDKKGASRSRSATRTSSKKRDRSDSSASSASSGPRKKPVATAPGKEPPRDAQRGDIIYHAPSNGFGLALAKGRCRLATGTEVEMQSNTARIDADWNNTRLAILKKDKYIDVSPSGSALACPPLILSRDTGTGSGKPSLAVLSLPIVPNATATYFVFTLVAQCKIKKCDPPETEGAPGPLTVGMLPDNIAPSTSFKDISPEAMNQLVYFTTRFNLTEGHIFAAGKLEKTPALESGGQLHVLVDRMHGAVVWGVGGKIFRTPLPGSPTFRVFAGVSPGHELKLARATTQGCGRQYPNDLTELATTLAMQPVYTRDARTDQAFLMDTLQFSQRMANAIYVRHLPQADVLLVTVAACVMSAVQQRLIIPSPATPPQGAGCCAVM